MTTTTVLFDLDETLVVEEAAVEAAFLATCARVPPGFGIDPKVLSQSVRERARELWQASPAYAYCLAIGISSWEGLWARFQGEDPNLAVLREWAPTYRREAWSRALADHGLRDAALAEHLAAAFIKEQRERRIAFPDAHAVLGELRAGYKIGLVTNGVPDLQREKLQAADLTPYFDAVIVSSEVGVGKPDPRIFNAALEALASVAQETVMVGDHLRRDVQGAQQLGIRAIWLNRLAKDRGDDVKPDAEMASLTELPDLLGLKRCPCPPC